MTSDSLRGLTIKRTGNGWGVYHEGSGLPVIGGGLRQRRFADEARTELLATGADFTQASAHLRYGSPAATAYRPVMIKWLDRSNQDFTDDTTFEHYSTSVHYGQAIPSAALAREAREIVAAGDPEAIGRLWPRLYGSRHPVPAE